MARDRSSPSGLISRPMIRAMRKRGSATASRSSKIRCKLIGGAFMAIKIPRCSASSPLCTACSSKENAQVIDCDARSACSTLYVRVRMRERRNPFANKAHSRAHVQCGTCGTCGTRALSCGTTCGTKPSSVVQTRFRARALVFFFHSKKESSGGQPYGQH